MGDALETARAHAEAAAAALEGAAEPPAAPAAPVAMEVRHEAPDLEPVASASEHISDNDVEIARIQAAAETERAALSAATAEHMATITALEERIAAFEGRLSSVEGRAHDHAESESAPRAESGPTEAVEELESDAGAGPSSAAAPVPSEESGPASTARRPGLHFRRRA